MTRLRIDTVGRLTALGYSMGVQHTEVGPGVMREHNIVSKVRSCLSCPEVRVLVIFHIEFWELRQNSVLVDVLVAHRYSKICVNIHKSVGR